MSESDDLMCSITCQLYADPVSLKCSGKTYERDAIEEWLKQNNRCPLTRILIENKNDCIVPNEQMKLLVNKFIRDNPDEEKNQYKIDTNKKINEHIARGSYEKLLDYELFDLIHINYIDIIKYCSNHIDMTRHLVLQNVLRHVFDKAIVYDTTPVMYWAIRYSKADFIKFLISLGLDINVYHNGEHAIFTAIEHEKNDVVELLLDSNTIDMNMLSPLTKMNVIFSMIHYKMPIHIIEKALNKGVNYNAICRNDTLLFFAARFSPIEVFKLVASKHDWDFHKMNEIKYNILYAAFQSNNIDVVKFLLDYGIDILQPCGEQGDLPLDACFTFSNANIIEHVIHHLNGEVYHLSGRGTLSIDYLNSNSVINHDDRTFLTGLVEAYNNK